MNKHEELLVKVIKGVVNDDDATIVEAGRTALKEFATLKAREILAENNDVTDADKNGPAGKSASKYLEYVKNNLVDLFKGFHNELDTEAKDKLLHCVGNWGKVNPNFREVVKRLSNINDEKEANELIGKLVGHFTANDNDKILAKVRAFKDDKMWKVKV